MVFELVPYTAHAAFPSRRARVVELMALPIEERHVACFGASYWGPPAVVLPTLATPRAEQRN